MSDRQKNEVPFQLRKEKAIAQGFELADGFLVKEGSTAMREGSPAVKRNRGLTQTLLAQGVLVPDQDPELYRFSKDHLFSSKSAAAGVVIDGNSNGSHWRPVPPVYRSELKLDGDVISRWISALKSVFQGFKHFDPPNQEFDEAEIEFKLKRTQRLREKLDECGSDTEYAEAIRSAFSGYSLLNQFLMIKFGWDWPKADLGRVIGQFVESDGTEVESFVSDFTKIWMRDCPEPQRDHARQVASLFAMQLFPSDAVYFRRTILDELYQEATGQPFPRSEDPAEEYAEELRFARAVERAFAERGLAPRNLMDVQSALWVVGKYNSETTDITRESVEAAMDAYEAFLERREHAEIFEAFGEPRDYWVRSTRARRNPVFPTKPLIGFIQNNPEITGGWSTKGSAAAQLHNAGYIIVDRANTPISPPEQLAHLLRDADRIRQSALVYHILPARERQERQVRIRAGDLAKDLFLQQRLPNVCQSLRGNKFQNLAKVQPPQTQGPDVSPSTTFVFTLEEGGMPTSQEKKPSKLNLPLNTILYGPPGTGKTYETAARAVRICDGGVPEDRGAVMTRYAELCAANRIEFVTFHQSYGYEEFVEGLRPMTGGDGQGAGFRLEPVDGALKKMAMNARRPIAATDPNHEFSTENRQIFKVALGMQSNPLVEEQRQACFDNGYIANYFGGEVDWSPAELETYEAMLAYWRSLPGNKNASHKNQHVEQAWQIRSRMKPDDVVVVPSGLRKICAIGIVTGDYEYVATDKYDYRHHRPVNWVWIDETGNGIDVSDFYDSDLSSHMLNGLNMKKVRWGGLLPYLVSDAEYAEATPLPHVLIVDEINRANISKVMGEMITLLEEDKREGQENELSVVLPHSKKHFTLPSNLHILGTMNTADRSIALLDTALRRRFHFEAVDPDPSLLNPVGGIDLAAVLTAINQRLEYLIGPDHLIGHAWMMGARDIAHLDDIMANKVIPLLREYFHEDLGRVRAVLGGGDAFLHRVELTAPPGLDEGYGETRYRYVVAPSFGAAAYRELILGVSDIGDSL
ncbi:AAA family ATPase [Shimia sp. SDUM112013]|uniref:AAA family ATPase n=1 Tax=Shimia sp. SDUM112013 TaxID=3136160 RepID=UPI0032F0552F